MRRQRLASRLAGDTYQSSACIKLRRGSLTVTDSYFHDNRWDAIWCDTLLWGVVDIRNSRFVHNGRAGFTWEVSGDSTPGDHAYLQGNTFLDNGWYLNPFGSGGHAGIIISDSANIEITGNTFKGNLALDHPGNPRRTHVRRPPQPTANAQHLNPRQHPQPRTKSKPTAPPGKQHHTPQPNTERPVRRRLADEATGQTDGSSNPCETAIDLPDGRPFERSGRAHSRDRKSRRKRRYERDVAPPHSSARSSSAAPRARQEQRGPRPPSAPSPPSPPTRSRHAWRPHAHVRDRRSIPLGRAGKSRSPCRSSLPTGAEGPRAAAAQCARPHRRGTNERPRWQRECPWRQYRHE